MWPVSERGRGEIRYLAIKSSLFSLPLLIKLPFTVGKHMLSHPSVQRGKRTFLSVLRRIFFFFLWQMEGSVIGKIAGQGWKKIVLPGCLRKFQNSSIYICTLFGTMQGVPLRTQRNSPPPTNPNFLERSRDNKGYEKNSCVVRSGSIHSIQPKNAKLQKKYMANCIFNVSGGGSLSILSL